MWLIRANVIDQKRRATFDLVNGQFHDADFVSARQTVLALHDQKSAPFTQYLQDRSSPEYQAILKSLNHYEFIASGIRTGAFDEKIFKRMYYSVLLRDWNALSGFIEEIRRQTGIRTLFQEFKWLGNRWQNKPLERDVV